MKDGSREGRRGGDLGSCVEPFYENAVTLF